MLVRPMHAAVVSLLSREGFPKLLPLDSHCHEQNMTIRLLRLVLATHLPAIVYDVYTFRN